MAKKIACLVCGEAALDDSLSFEYAGVRYAFCGVQCRAHFTEECEIEHFQTDQGAGDAEPGRE